MCRAFDTDVEFCDEGIHNFAQNITNIKKTEGRAILAPTNMEVDGISDLMEEKMRVQ